jgi:hypothetical protein
MSDTLLLQAEFDNDEEDWVGALEDANAEPTTKFNHDSDVDMETQLDQLLDDLDTFDGEDLEDEEIRKMLLTREHDLMERAKQYDKDLEKARQQIIKESSEKYAAKIEASPLVFATMTVVGSLNCALDIKEVTRGCMSRRAMKAICPKIIGEFKWKSSSNSNKTFRNSFTLTLVDALTSRSISIKCFVNGMLHVTGALRFSDSVRVMKTVCRFLDAATHLAPGTRRIYDAKAAMINGHVHVKAGHAIYLRRLQSQIEKEFPDKAVKFNDSNSKNYAGLKITYHYENGDISQSVYISVFGPGGIMIAGKLIEHELLVNAYRFIIDIMSRHWDYVANAKKKVSGKRKIEDVEC